MQLPALQVRQPDVGNALFRAAQIKSAGTRNKLLEAEAAREAETRELAGPALDAALGGQGGNAMTTLAGGTTQTEGVPEPLRRYVSASGDVAGALRMLEFSGKADDKQRKLAKEKAGVGGRLALAVLDAPPERQPGAYAQMLQMAQGNGFDVDDAPPKWGQEAQAWTQMQLAQMLSLDEMLTLRKARKEPSIVEVYDEQTGRKRKGYMQGGRFVPVGGEAAPDAGGGKPTALITNIEWLVDNKIVPNKGAAFAAMRERVGMDDVTLRTKALDWVGSQKDKYDRPKYATPEAQNAAFNAYMKIAQEADGPGAMQLLKGLEPEAEGGDEGVAGTLKSIWRTMSGGDGRPGFAKAGGGFDPEGSGYDDARARAAGMTPAGAEAGDNAGHMGSVAPTTPEERKRHNLPEDSYAILKGRKHDTWDKAVAAEEARGFMVIKKGDRYFSVPKEGAKATGGPTPQGQGAKAMATDGKEYPVVADQKAYDALPAGATYYHPGKKQFLVKGK